MDKPGPWDSHWERHVPGKGERWLIRERQKLIDECHALAALPGDKRPSVVVEMGSGAGHNLSGLSQGVLAVGIDRSPAALRLYSKLYPEGRARMCMADIRDLPFPDHSIDLAYSAGVLEHFSESEKKDVLRELHRVLRPHGVLLITVPGRLSLWRFWRLLRRIDFGYEEYHSQASLRSILSNNRFHVLRSGGLDPLSLNSFLTRFLGVALPFPGLPGSLNTEVYAVARTSSH